jgi:hypothetical protein
VKGVAVDRVALRLLGGGGWCDEVAQQRRSL